MKIDIDDVMGQIRELQRKMGAIGGADLPIEFGSSGIEQDLDKIKTTSEGLISWENRVCVLYIRDQRISKNSIESPFKFHVSDCKTIRRMKSSSRSERYVITNRNDGLFMVQPVDSSGAMVERQRLVSMVVCENCMINLDWDGYKGLDGDERSKVLSSFSIRDFFDVYETRRWPVVRKRPTAESLGTVSSSSRLGVSSGTPEVRSEPSPTTQQVGLSPSWGQQIEDIDFRNVLIYIDKHEIIHEGALIGMLGGGTLGARRARRFANKLEFFESLCPFRILVGLSGGQKVYRVRRRIG